VPPKRPRGRPTSDFRPAQRRPEPPPRPTGPCCRGASLSSKSAREGLGSAASATTRSPAPRCKISAAWFATACVAAAARSMAFRAARSTCAAARASASPPRTVAASRAPAATRPAARCSRLSAPAWNAAATTVAAATFRSAAHASAAASARLSATDDWEIGLAPIRAT